MNRKERYQHYLELCGSLPEGQGTIYHEFAKVATGRHTNDEAFIRYLSHMRIRKDCGDFRLILMLRMLYLYPNTKLVGEEALAELKDLFLDFDYWFGENVKFPGQQIIWTENHIMLFMTCEYLVTQLYPDEFFRFRGKKGREITPEIRPKVLDWIDMKLKVGFSEWDSNCYTDENLICLLNLYDFAQDAELAAKSRALVDVITFSMAINSYQGNYCATHGRTYPEMIIKKDCTATTLLEKLLWGTGTLESQEGLLHLGSLALATSRYEPQPLIDAIALDQNLVLEDREQQSFNVEDAPLFGKGYESYEDLTLFWHNMAYTHEKIVENMFKMCEKFGIMVNPAVYPEYRYVLDCKKKGITPEPCRVGNYMCRVNKLTYKTPDYLLSCAQDFRKGELGFQQHIWQATLADDAIVFTNQPGTRGFRDGRPDFWSGNYRHPRAVQYRDVVICIYQIAEDSPVPYSHAYFPREKFDECYSVGNWTFGRKGDGYVALYSQNGMEWTTDNPRWVGIEAACFSKENIWICQMGRKTEYGTFERFISEILRAEIHCECLQVRYQSPKNGEIGFGWEGDLTVDGSPISIRDYKRFDTPLCQSEYLSGKYDISYQGKTLHIE
ncbi:MAG: hypothetical protein ACOX6P_01065 [Candidatus Merdivicinus sp.]|jgi:hypothetical protein